MAEHEEFLDLCAGYVLESASAEERTRLESHLRDGCRLCARALAEMREATVALAHMAPRIAPPPELRRRVLEATGGSRRAEVRPRRWPRLVSSWSVAALFAIAAVLGWSQWWGARSELNRLEERIQHESEWMAVLSSSHAKLLELALQESATGPLGARAAYDPESRRLLLVVENMTPPSGHDYELWALRDGGPVSLGLIVAETDGEGMLRLRLAEKHEGTTGFAISLEPKGGSPGGRGPSGPVVLAGTFGEK